jgi:acyl carrier protein
MTAPTTRHSAVLADNLHRGWLLDRLALYLNRPADSIDPSVPLAEFGMDSVAALSLCGDLEDQFGLYVEPTLLWDHPTVESLVGYMAVEIPRVAEDNR